MLSLVVILVAVAAITEGANHHHNNHNYVPLNPDQVHTELENIQIHFANHLCLDLLLLDCAAHEAQLTHDEMVCGTNGVTYNNHCEYVHAACMFENVLIANHGPCTAQTQTVAPMTSDAPVVSGATVSSGPTTTPTPTLDPTSQAIHNVFCSNKDNVICPTAMDVKCGSDGQSYNNHCEFTKAVCDNPLLKEVTCSMTTMATP